MRQFRPHTTSDFYYQEIIVSTFSSGFIPTSLSSLQPFVIITTQKRKNDTRSLSITVKLDMCRTDDNSAQIIVKQ